MAASTLKCLIIDDEPSAQAVLKHFIGMIDFIEIKAICFNAQEAEMAMQKHNDVNLIFLDINMPKVSGLNFYKSLQHPPEVILTTAYPHYAVEAFNINAIDYLLKPIALERFQTAVNKAFDKLNNNQPSEHQFIIVKANKVIHQININTIKMIEAFGDYVKIHTSDKMIVTYASFMNMLSELPENQFLRCHRSYAVNKTLVQVVAGNTIHIDKHQIPIGQKYKSEFLEKLNNQNN